MTVRLFNNQIDCKEVFFYNNPAFFSRHHCALKYIHIEGKIVESIVRRYSSGSSDDKKLAIWL